MKNVSIFFVILTYNPNVEDLGLHLKKFIGQKYILVDNSEILNEYSKDIKVVKTGKNLGYAGGMNIGMQYCLDHGADWIVITNDDLSVAKKSLQDIRDELEHVFAGLAGPFIGAVDVKRWSTIYPAKNAHNSSFIYFSGSCLAIHKSVIHDIGMFYEPYFIYYEDVEYCLRVIQKGFLLTPLKLTGIDHQDGNTFRKKSFLHEYYLSRNHLLFVERNAPMGVKIHEFFRLPKTIWEHVKKKEWGALMGIRDYFLRRFGQCRPL